MNNELVLWLTLGSAVLWSHAGRGLVMIIYSSSITQTSLSCSVSVKKKRPTPTAHSGRMDRRSGSSKRTKSFASPPEAGTDQILDPSGPTGL